VDYGLNLLVTEVILATFDSPHSKEK
jgi:hypothetical protein